MLRWSVVDIRLAMPRGRERRIVSRRGKTRRSCSSSRCSTPSEIAKEVPRAARANRRLLILLDAGEGALRLREARLDRRVAPWRARHPGPWSRTRLNDIASRDLVEQPDPLGHESRPVPGGIAMQALRSAPPGSHRTARGPSPRHRSTLRNCTANSSAADTPCCPGAGLEGRDHRRDVADHEDLARVDVEDLRRIDPAVRTGDHHHPGRLPLAQLCPAGVLNSPIASAKPVRKRRVAGRSSVVIG